MGTCLSQSPQPCYFIGTLSQTLTLRAAFMSSTYLLSQIPGPGRSSDDDLFTSPFKRGDQGLRAFHRRNGFPCPPASARHLRMPAGTRGRGPRSGRAWSSQGLLVAIHTWSSSGAARKLQITNYLAKIRVGKITTLKMAKLLSLSDLQVALMCGYGDTLVLS